MPLVLVKASVSPVLAPEVIVAIAVVTVVAPESSSPESTTTGEPPGTNSTMPDEDFTATVSTHAPDEQLFDAHWFAAVQVAPAAPPHVLVTTLHWVLRHAADAGPSAPDPPQLPRSAGIVTPAARPTTQLFEGLPALQYWAYSQTASDWHAVGVPVSAGQLDDVPEQVSATSQSVVDARQTVPASWRLSAGQVTLAPLQSSSLSHSPTAARQTAPPGVGEQVPIAPGMLQASHAFPHAASQQTPSAQKPVWHSVPSAQELPFGELPTPQMPELQVYPVEHWVLDEQLEGQDADAPPHL